MSAIPQPPSARFVSDRILEPLRQVARRQWTVLAAMGVIQTLLVSLSVILAVVLILGRFDNIPVWIRIPVALLVWGSVIGSAVYFLRPALHRRSLVRTALDVEERMKSSRDTHERISSSVELGAERDARYAGSPALVAHLVKQAESDADAVDPKKVVPADKVIRLGMILAPLLLLWIVLSMIISPRHMLKPMFNLLMPWREAPAALTHVAVDPGNVTLAQGDNLDIKVHVNADSAADRDKKIQHATLTITDATGVPTVQEMARTGPRDFHFAFENLQKTFKYVVGTDEADSAQYTATVNPRPSVEQLDVAYNFPTYTGLASRLDNNSETGAIDAIQGTKVTITVHCSNTLTADSKIVVTDKVTGVKAEPKDYPLAKAGEGLYQMQFVVVNGAQYAIKLTNNFGLNNKDDQPHPITARYDEKPTITITGPQSGITARPDDVVPVTFLATDDFGVSKVEAFVQIDGAPAAKGAEVKLRAGGRQSVNDKYKLDIAKALAEAGLPDAAGLTYWLKATDNRDPDPQSAESTHQTIKIDKNSKSLAEQMDEKRAKDIMEAIRKAIQEIDQEKPQSDQYTWLDKNRALNNDEKQGAEGLKDKIEKTSTDLTKAADEHTNDAFADVAAKAKDIAQKPILTAAEDVAKIELHGDQAEVRMADAKAASKSLVDAKKELEALLKKAEEVAKNVDAADKIAQVAKDQQKLAEQAAKPQQANQPQNAQQQQQVAQKTQEAAAQTPALQDPKAQQEAQKLAQLLNKLAEIEKAQEKQEQQVQKQAQVAELQEQANEIAKKQEALNQKIEDFKKEEKTPLEKAQAQTPQPQQEQNIVKELNANQLQQAAAEQKAAAQQLDQAAAQLQQKANDNTLQPNAEQQAALNKDQQDAAQAAAEAQQAAQEAQAAQQAQQATQQAQQQAQQAQNATPDQKKNAAQQAAQAAQKAAEVAKQVEAQAKQIEKQAEAAAQDSHADVQQAAQAAEKAAQAAEKAAEKAEAAAQQAQADAQQGDAQKAGADAAEAGADAAEAAKQEQAAAQQLAQAENKDAEHAKGEMLQQQKDQAAQAAAEAKELAKEQAALADADAAKAQELAQAQQGAEAPAQAAAEQKQLEQQTKQAEAEAQQLGQAAEAAGNKEMAKRADTAQQDLKQAEAAQGDAAQAEAAGNPEQAAGQQEKAENALAKAEQALRGEAGQQADAAKPDAGQPDAGQPDAGKPDAGKPDAGQADAGKPDAGQGQEAGKPDAGNPEAGQAQAAAAEPHPGEAGQPDAAQAQAAATPAQAMKQAAEHVQEAIQAQQQAAQGNPEAAQEAAQALAEAAQELAQATTPGQPGNEPGTEPGQDPGQGKEPSTVAGKSADPKMGIMAQMNGGSDAPPPSVTELGISASDWAKLGPLQQRELLNAAQQSGPPGYQAMIKNYYVRLARMQAQAGAAR